MKKYVSSLIFWITTVFVVFSCGFVCGAETGVGGKAPEFSLKDTHGNTHALSDHLGKLVVLEWNNPDCPFVKKHYEGGNMQNLQKTYTGKDVIWLTVNSSALGKQGNYPPEKLNEITAERQAAPTAVLIDPDGTVGKLYGAKTTPHMFIVDPKGVLIYQGAIDSKPSTSPADIASSENYVSKALDEAMAGGEVSTPSTSPYGCSVKY